MPLRPGHRAKVVIVLAMVAVLVVVALVRLPGWGTRTIAISADFADTTGIYLGNEVQYLGVPIGKVTGITPRGRVVTVRMLVDADTPLPRDAGAEILQSALLTDRFVQIGPAYTGGPRLAADAHIDQARTRSPISIDDVGKAVDDLVVALDRTGPGGRDVGDLLHATARTFDGNGAQIRELVDSSRAALAALDDNAPDLEAVVANLSVVARTLGARDATIRRFTRNLATSSDVVAAQSSSLGPTLASLEDLTAQVSSFVKKNGSKVTADLRDAAEVAATIQQHQGQLASIFDLLPTGAENIARAFDPKRKALRVQIALRDFLVFSNVVRSEMCKAIVGPLCSLLFKADGGGLLDGLLDQIVAAFPGKVFPWK
ncbi:MAG: hypothetical protein JWQ74_1282 [Marmoricola sp.]|nr:hypothetical protein [Marmoricola sp.]